MPLPETVTVKLSSEAAGYVAMTPVVVQDFALRELLEHVASATGKDADRVREILRRGTLVCGGTRYRWSQLEVTAHEAAAALALLPDPEPARPLDRARCTMVVLTGPGVRIQIERAAAERRRLLKRRSFWDSLFECAAKAVYVDYIYRERVDLYRSTPDAGEKQRLREDAGLLTFAALEKQIRGSNFVNVEFQVSRL